jgi:hypothetical protein
MLIRNALIKHSSCLDDIYFFTAAAGRQEGKQSSETGKGDNPQQDQRMGKIQ